MPPLGLLRIEAHIFVCFLPLPLKWEFTRRLKEIADKKLPMR